MCSEDDCVRVMLLTTHAPCMGVSVAYWGRPGSLLGQSQGPVLVPKNALNATCRMFIVIPNLRKTPIPSLTKQSMQAGKMFVANPTTTWVLHPHDAIYSFFQLLDIE